MSGGRTFIAKLARIERAKNNITAKPVRAIEIISRGELEALNTEIPKTNVAPKGVAQILDKLF